MRVSRTLSFLLVWWVAVAPACGWGRSVHRLIAYRAMHALSRELPLPPARAWPVLWKSVVEPDKRGARGFLPAEDHVFHVTLEARGKRFGKAPRRAQELAWRVMAEPLDDEETLHELARLCHLVSDLCQPLHADGKRRNPREREVHGPYEKDADRDVRLAAVGVTAARAGEGGVEPPGPSSIEQRMEDLARASVRDYDAICAAYLGEGGAAGTRGYEAVAGVTRAAAERAVRETVALWRVVLARRGVERRQREQAARWAWVAVPVVLAFFAVRARWAPDRPRWPGALPVRRDEERAASDRAFRELERRLGLREESS